MGLSPTTTTPPFKSRRNSLPQTPATPVEPGEISSEEGEVTLKAERAAMEAQIDRDISGGTADVQQKDARYFTLDNVVCSHCGTKGHLSYDCPEEIVQMHCNLCGGVGHSSQDCPEDGCFICKKPGHRARDCSEKRRRIKRRIGPARLIHLDCYVCGGDGHLDCSLVNMPAGVLSCYNCGMKGHAGSECHVSSVERMVPIVKEMERERRAAKNAKEKGRPRRKDGDYEEVDDDQPLTAQEFRDRFLDRAQQRRYNRGGTGRGK